VEGSIQVEGKLSISKIAENITIAKDKSCIYRFLSKSPWDDKQLNRNRISFLSYHLEHNIRPGEVGFLVIDGGCPKFCVWMNEKAPFWIKLTT
jgi:hypothetical protein